MFAPDAIEIRFVVGPVRGGPATGWFRMRVPLVDGEEASPLQRLAAAGDFGNGISAILSWDDYLFINPDLTLYIERDPVGEWIGLQSETILAPGGIGTAESVIYDERGRVGRAVQALLRRPALISPPTRRRSRPARAGRRAGRPRGGSPARSRRSRG